MTGLPGEKSASLKPLFTDRLVRSRRGVEGACQRKQALLGSQLIHSPRLLFQMGPG